MRDSSEVTVRGRPVLVGTNASGQDGTSWYRRRRAPVEEPSAIDLPTDVDPRRRLLRGIAAAVAEKGYVATTIADVVGHARVSKRTFYEHFPDKQACYLEAYRRGTDRLGRRMLEAGVAAEGPWRERLRAAIAAYLAVLADAPASTRTFTAEIQAAGPEAVAARRAMHRRTAEALTQVVDHVRRDEPALAPLPPILADAVVGALTELVGNAVADGRTGEIPGLDEPVLALLAAVLTAPADDAVSAPSA
jgi:AcrR family transcriptional regulator